MDILAGEAYQECSTLKGKNLLPLWVEPFSKGSFCTSMLGMLRVLCLKEKKLLPFRVEPLSEGSFLYKSAWNITVI